MSKEEHFVVLFLNPALQSLWGPADYKEEMDEMLTEQAAIEAAPPRSPLQLLSDRTVRWQLISMSLIYTCNQLSGMSAVSMELRLALSAIDTVHSLEEIEEKFFFLQSVLLS